MEEFDRRKKVEMFNDMHTFYAKGSNFCKSETNFRKELDQIAKHLQIHVSFFLQSTIASKIFSENFYFVFKSTF